MSLLVGHGPKIGHVKGVEFRLGIGFCMAGFENSCGMVPSQSFQLVSPKLRGHTFDSTNYEICIRLGCTETRNGKMRNMKLETR